MPESAAIALDALLQLTRAEPLALGLLGVLAFGALLLLFVVADFSAWRRRAYPTKVAFATFAASVTAAALLALLLFVADLRTVAQHAMSQVLVEDARLARQLDSWLAAQREQVSALARDLPRSAYRRLEQHLLANSGVRSMLAADSSGAIYAGVRRASNTRGVQRLAGSGTIAGRAYFTEPMRTGSAYLADAFAIEVTDADPVLAVSAPVGARGDFGGIVQATLVPAALGALLDADARTIPADVMVLDANERVLQASEGFGAAVMQPVADAGIKGTLEQDAPLRLTAGARPLLYSQAELANGWLVASRTDLSGVLDSARRRGLLLAVGLALLVLLATLAAPRTVRPISEPLRPLGQGMAGFDPARSRATLRAPHDQ